MLVEGPIDVRLEMLARLLGRLPVRSAAMLAECGTIPNDSRLTGRVEYEIACSTGSWADDDRLVILPVTRFLCERTVTPAGR